MKKIITYSSMPDINMTYGQIHRDAISTLRSATIAVQRILEQREQLDREGRQNETLVVLAGEFHPSPAHTLHQMLVLKGLTESKEKTVFGYEFEHNILSQTFFIQTTRRPVPAIEQALQKRKSNDGTLEMQSYTSFWGVNTADHSTNILFHYLLHNDQIAVCFTDTVDTGNYLDPNDPSTAHSIQKCVREVSEDIHQVRPKGIQVRNHHTAKIMTAFAKEHKARIAVQHCGNGHVNGYKQEKWPAHQSLAAYFKIMGMPVFAIPLLCKDFNGSSVPTDSNLKREEIYLCRGVPDKTAIYLPFTDNPVPDEPADFECRAAEALYINALLERTGMGSERLSLEKHKETIESFKMNVKKQFKEWDNEFFPTFTSRVRNQMGLSL